jgi:hypothetical protein
MGGSTILTAMMQTHLLAHRTGSDSLTAAPPYIRRKKSMRMALHIMALAGLIGNDKIHL